MDYVRCSDLRGRFTAYGLPPPLSLELHREVKKWETNSGPKWTVVRLKSLKTDFLRLKSNQTPLTWVAKNRKGEWKGVWGSLVRFSAQGLKQFEIVINCLMCYSSFVPSEPTEEHVEKMRKSVGATEGFIPKDIYSSLRNHAQAVLGALKLGPNRPLVTFSGRVATKSPIWKGRSVPQHSHLYKELDWFREEEHSDFAFRHFRCYSGVTEGLDIHLLRSFGVSFANSEAYQAKCSEWDWKHSILPKFQPVAAGNLAPLTKDGGWKVRWIANPYRIHQLALYPLGSALFKALSGLPWDCTFQQDKAFPALQEHLRKGREVYSVDLSSATDYFPLSLQLDTLRALFPKGIHQVELFGELSRCIWNAGPYGEVCWSKGQPMGLFPSFASFALTHGLLLDMLSGGVPGQFYVLGDDVVITHKPLYERYLEVLDILGCPYDPHKSFISSDLCEFAGKIVTPEKVVSSFKWRDPNSKNFLDLMRTFGQRFEPMLGRREKRVYHAICSFLPPVGLNHSQGPGKPLEQVVLETEEFLSQLPKAHGRVVHTDLFHRLVELLQPQLSLRLFSRIDISWFKRETKTLDERVSRAFRWTPFGDQRGFYPGDRGILADFLEVNHPESLMELPSTGPRERVDQGGPLEYYERILGFTD